MPINPIGTPVTATSIGEPGGVAGLDESGYVPLAQLPPDLVADVHEHIVEVLTLTADMISNEWMSLASTPVDRTDVILDIEGAPDLVYGVDYEIQAVNATRLRWDGLALSGVIGEGDIAQVKYAKL